MNDDYPEIDANESNDGNNLLNNRKRPTAWGETPYSDDTGLNPQTIIQNSQQIEDEHIIESQNYRDVLTRHIQEIVNIVSISITDSPKGKITLSSTNPHREGPSHFKNEDTDEIKYSNVFPSSTHDIVIWDAVQDILTHIINESIKIPTTIDLSSVTSVNYKDTPLYVLFVEKDMYKTKEPQSKPYSSYTEIPTDPDDNQIRVIIQNTLNQIKQILTKLNNRPTIFHPQTTTNSSYIFRRLTHGSLSFPDSQPVTVFKYNKNLQINIIGPGVPWWSLSGLDVKQIQIEITNKDNTIKERRYIGLGELFTHESFNKITKIKKIGKFYSLPQSNFHSFEHSLTDRPPTRLDNINILLDSCKNNQQKLKALVKEMPEIIESRIRTDVFTEDTYNSFKENLHTQLNDPSQVTETIDQTLQSVYSQDAEMKKQIFKELSAMRAIDNLHDFIILLITIYPLVLSSIPESERHAFEQYFTNSMTRTGFADQGKLRAQSGEILKRIINLVLDKGVHIPQHIGVRTQFTQYQYDQYVARLTLEKTQGFTVSSLCLGGEGGKFVRASKVFGKLKTLSDDNLSEFLDGLGIEIHLESFKEIINRPSEYIDNYTQETVIPLQTIDGACSQSIPNETMCNRWRFPISENFLVEIFSFSIKHTNARHLGYHFHYVILYYCDDAYNISDNLNENAVVIFANFLSGNISVNGAVELMIQKARENSVDQTEISKMTAAFRGKGNARTSFEQITPQLSWNMIISTISNLPPSDESVVVVYKGLLYIQSVFATFITIDSGFDNSTTSLPYSIPIETVVSTNYGEGTILDKLRLISRRNNINNFQIIACGIAAAKLAGDGGYTAKCGGDKRLEILHSDGNFEQMAPSQTVAIATPDHLLYLMQSIQFFSGTSSKIPDIFSKTPVGTYNVWLGLSNSNVDPGVITSLGIVSAFEIYTALLTIENMHRSIYTESYPISDILEVKNTYEDILGSIDGDILSMFRNIDIKRIKNIFADVFRPLDEIDIARANHINDAYYNLSISVQKKQRSNLEEYFRKVIDKIQGSDENNIFKNLSTIPSLEKVLSSGLWDLLLASESTIISFNELFELCEDLTNGNLPPDNQGLYTYFISESTMDKIIPLLDEKKPIEYTSGTPSFYDIQQLLIEDDDGFGKIPSVTQNAEGVMEIQPVEETEDTVQNTLFVVFYYDRSVPSPVKQLISFGSHEVVLLKTIPVKKDGERTVLGYLDFARIYAFGPELLYDIFKNVPLSDNQYTSILTRISEQQYTIASEVLTDTVMAEEHVIKFLQLIKYLSDPKKKQRINDNSDDDDTSSIGSYLEEDSVDGGFKPKYKTQLKHKSGITKNKTKKTHTIQKNKRSNRRIRKLGVYTHKRNRKPIIKNKRKTNRHKTKSRRSISNRK
jgi:hypothetical protein